MEKKKIIIWIIPIILLIVLTTVLVIKHRNDDKIKKEITSFNDQVYQYLDEWKPIYQSYVIRNGNKEDYFYDRMDKLPFYVAEAQRKDNADDTFYISKNFEKICYVSNGDAMNIECNSKALAGLMMFVYAKDHIINTSIINYNEDVLHNNVSNMQLTYEYNKDQYIYIYYNEYDNLLDSEDVPNLVKNHIIYKVNMENKNYEKMNNK